VRVEATLADADIRKPSSLPRMGYLPVDSLEACRPDSVTDLAAVLTPSRKRGHQLSFLGLTKHSDLRLEDHDY
jgi:hypothetical protein